MRGVGVASVGLRPPLAVEAPDRVGVRAPAFGRGYFFEAVLLPEAAGVAERGDAALGAYPGPRENEDARSSRAALELPKLASV